MYYLSSVKRVDISRLLRHDTFMFMTGNRIYEVLTVGYNSVTYFDIVTKKEYTKKYEGSNSHTVCVGLPIRR